MDRAVILFAHGARDPQWAEPLERLAQTLRERAPDVEVMPAFLELMSPALDEAVDALLARGHRSITVLPVFWAGGGHVLRDLPALLAGARARHPGLEIHVLPVLSDLPGVLEAIADAALGSPADRSD